MSRTGGPERRRQLIGEAIRAFGERGYEGTTLEAVAEAAGVRKQTLLYYFSSKEELFDACVNEIISGLRRSLERVVEGPPDGWARVEGVIRSIFALAKRWPEFPFFVREAARRSPAVV
ncbi:MAG: TetR/AcrR family transcriptional regulator, partial [Acidimicrobiales bacterium]